MSMVAHSPYSKFLMGCMIRYRSRRMRRYVLFAVSAILRSANVDRQQCGWSESLAMKVFGETIVASR